mgnify:CR=1 FL=1
MTTSRPIIKMVHGGNHFMIMRKKIGIKNKRLTAGWDMDYLQHLLNVDIAES